MNITEIFYSLQGEGPLLGLPAVFIRLSGCMEPYCPWCDTKYALYESTEMTIDQIIEKLDDYPCNTVVITGGEPFMQWDEGLSDLHTELIRKGCAIQYETSGKTALPRIEDAVVVCSPKFIENKWWFDLSNLGKVHYYKFLASDQPSFREIEAFIQGHPILREQVYIMPMGETRDEQLSIMETVFTFCRDKGYRMTPRLHILSFDNVRGV